MNKLKKSFLVAGATITALGSLNSCKNAGEQNADPQGIKTERETELKKRADNVYALTRDSVLKANGYDRSVYSNLINASNKLCSIDALSQKTILRRNIDTLIARHARSTAQEITKFLNEHNVRVSKRSKTSILRRISITDFAHDEYIEYLDNKAWAKSKVYGDSEKIENVKAKLPQGMFGTSDNRFDCYAIDWSKYNYNKTHQDEIERGVLKIFDKMNRGLDIALRTEVKKFAVYYPVLNIGTKGVPAEYAGFYEDYDPIDYDSDTDKFECEYASTNLCVSRSVNVYNPKLNVNFFGDKNANYKLVKMGQGKWQVVRTDKNGRKAKTPVFTYDVDYSYYTHGGSRHDDEFEAEPGTNMGVRIYVSEEVWYRSGELNDKYPDPTGKIAAKRDSLTKEINRLEKLNDRMWKISGVADSIARIKYNEYLKKSGVKGR